MFPVASFKKFLFVCLRQVRANPHARFGVLRVSNLALSSCQSSAAPSRRVSPRDSNSGPQGEQQASLPIEPSCQPYDDFNPAVELGLVVYCCNPTTWQSEAGELL